MKDEMRERLRRLLLEDTECGRRPCSTCPYNYSDDACFEHMSGLIADHLIENGVTFKDVPDTNVGEWVSVKDRLPEIPEGWVENPDPLLYMMKNTKTIYAGYYGEGGMWRDKYFRQYADSRNGVDADDVLCWMYQHDLPQPPKENDYENRN